MSKAANILVSIRKEPFIAIELIWAIALIVDGVYLLLPNYVPPPGTVMEAFATSPMVVTAVAVMYVVTGLVTLVGAILNRRWIRNLSTSLLFVAFFFTVLIRILAVGLVPTLWVWPLLLAAVAVIDNWNINWKPS